MINRVLTKLVEKAEQYCISKQKELHICGTAGPDDIYMIRYPLFESKYLTVYIHRFLRSDADDHHDHPFNFWSYVAKGGYLEEILVPRHPNVMNILESPRGYFDKAITRRTPGSLAYRSAATVHRVIVDKERKYADRADAPLTLIILGKRFREWGFWKKVPANLTSLREFTPWHEYLGVDQNSEKARKHQ